MNWRLVGFYTAFSAFIAALVALVRGNMLLLVIECALMITGAVLSLHKPKGS